MEAARSPRRSRALPPAVTNRARADFTLSMRSASGSARPWFRVHTSRASASSGSTPSPRDPPTSVLKLARARGARSGRRLRFRGLGSGGRRRAQRQLTRGEITRIFSSRVRSDGSGIALQSRVIRILNARCHAFQASPSWRRRPEGRPAAQWRRPFGPPSWTGSRPRIVRKGCVRRRCRRASIGQREMRRHAQAEQLTHVPYSPAASASQGFR